MIYPSIDKLLNIVDSKYKLVHIAADRAKVMKEHKHYQMNEDEYVSKKEIIIFTCITIIKTCMRFMTISS